MVSKAGKETPTDQEEHTPPSIHPSLSTNCPAGQMLSPNWASSWVFACPHQHFQIDLETMRPLFQLHPCCALSTSAGQKCKIILRDSSHDTVCLESLELGSPFSCPLMSSWKVVCARSKMTCSLLTECFVSFTLLGSVCFWKGTCPTYAYFFCRLKKLLSRVLICQLQAISGNSCLKLMSKISLLSHLKGNSLFAEQQGK